MQTILHPDNNYKELDEYLISKNPKRIFLVCGKSVLRCNPGKYFSALESRLGIKVVFFDKFSPNPDYSSVVEGVSLFKASGCDMIIAAGGGSAIDVAKCVKLFCQMPEGTEYLKQDITPNDVPFLAIPTTAGTGSEATKFAVVYYKGEKQSVTHESCIPSIVLFDSSTLKSLPDYQKKATMSDALCHGIESFWSIKATDESREYARKAIKLILTNSHSYLNNENSGNTNMLIAANLAGKAINISQTTAGHALSYKLTSLTGIAHGHAAVLLLVEIWRYMLSEAYETRLKNGNCALYTTLLELAEIFGCKDVSGGLKIFENFVCSLNLPKPVIADEKTLEILVKSVNTERLKNNPIELPQDVICDIYRKVCK